MYLGIDIGGTKTLIGRFTRDGELQESFKFPTAYKYQDFLKDLKNAVDRITTKPWNLACVASPGRLNRETGVNLKFGNLPWENINLPKVISAITGTKVLIENDAKLAALSEARAIKPEPKKVLYITISTGIGTALVENGQLNTEYGDGGGKALFFEHQGKIVTWESFASGKAIVRRFGKPASEISDPHVWKIICHDIALGFMDIYAELQPNIIIIGGGVGAHFDKFEKPLMQELKKYESPLVKIPRVIGAKNPEQAVLLGCYQMMKDEIKAASKVS